MKKTFTLLFACFVINFISSQTICRNVDFTDIDSRITLPVDIGQEIGKGPFTIELWIDGASEIFQNTHPSLISNRDFTGKGVLLFFHGIWGGAENKMLALNYGDQNFFDTSCPLILDETCRHVAVVRDGDAVSYYFDGIFIYKKNINPELSWNSPLPIILGGDVKNSSATDYNGSIDELKFWKRPLSYAEISEIPYRKELIDPEGLVAHYRFISDDPEVVMDESGNEYHGFFGTEDEPTGVAVRTETCCSPIDISDVSELANQKLDLYPVPARDVLYLELQSLLQIDFEIVTPLGQIIQIGKISSLKTTINTETLVSGLYYLRLVDGHETVIKSFVVANH
ncbi:T9SS type A sorting domain-containing protein [Saprospiraceae bacterium]|nr:T9SS type A sorting domain-containing protein [Saprospiraceae bacterium]